MGWNICLAALAGAALYLLWANGIMVTQAKRALAYIEHERGRRASFSACTGFTRRRVNFARGGLYHFTFTAQLSKGSVTAELLDAAKQPVLVLSPDAPTGDARVDGKGRYYLVFRFQSATGKYTLDWN